MPTNLRLLISKLGSTSMTATETAAGSAVVNGHYEVDIEHLLLELLKIKNSDVYVIFEYFGLHIDLLSGQLNEVVSTFKNSGSKTPILSINLIKLIEMSWVVSSVDFSSNKIRSGHLLIALLKDAQLFNFFSQRVDQLEKIATNILFEQFLEITKNSIEQLDDRGSEKDLNGAPLKVKESSHSEMSYERLNKYATDMTELVNQGLIDPVIGRDSEIRQLIDILSRRRQNNPILIGEAGVGKTAVVEGLALKIRQGDVPFDLKSARVFSLDLGLLQAGASVKGEFESRLKGVIEEIEKSAVPIILFVDETHTLVGAGGQSGQNDAANLLKPALARGALRTIGATTWSEYKKYIEKDSALSRRFQVIKVKEPTEEQAITMLRGIAKKMETHHGVRILDEAVVAAVKLSNRYISGRLLPDKAISVLDTAAARSSISMESLPTAIEDFRAQRGFYETELDHLRSERMFQDVDENRIEEIKSQLKELNIFLVDYEKQWEIEKELIERLKNAKSLLDLDKPISIEDGTPETDNEILKDQYQLVMKELSDIQGESPMISPLVNSRLINEVISDWTGIPTGKMMSNQIQTLQKLETLLKARVIGQDHALKTISQRIKTASSGLEDPKKPIGVFLLVGTSGVGKTETAVALSDIFYGGERSLITINMSEYQESHSVSLLRGSPPGYVGYGSGGVLTEAVKRQPYSVLLLDEVEKAHPDVLEVFFQIFDKGIMDDGEGQEVDFKNTIILLTSNACSVDISEAFGADDHADIEDVVHAIRPKLHKVFQPAFLGRLTIIPYKPISDLVLTEIVKSKLYIIERRLFASHSINLKYDSKVIDCLVGKSHSVDIGARAIDNVMNTLVVPVISELVLESMANRKIISEITVRYDSESNFTFEVTHKNVGPDSSSL